MRKLLGFQSIQPPSVTPTVTPAVYRKNHNSAPNVVVDDALKAE
jgi:hypothetical protein